MPNRHTEAVLLTKQFLIHLKKKRVNEYGIIEATTDYKAKTLHNMYACLHSGYSYDELLNMIEESTDNPYTMEKLIIKEYNPNFQIQSIKKDPDELIVIGQFYCHPLLQETSRPPQYVYDEEEGTLTKQTPEPFFLEIKEHFTVRDVLMHYYISHQKEPLPGTGALTQMTNIAASYPLDLVLYMIDASAEAINEGSGPGAGTPAFLPDYFIRAQEMLDKRKQTLREGGLTHVTPRHTYRTL